MATYEKELFTLLSTDLFKQILGSGNLQLVQLNAVLTLLVKSKIPFNLQYSTGTRRVAAGFNLEVIINPTTTLKFTIPIEEGGTIFNFNI